MINRGLNFLHFDRHPSGSGSAWMILLNFAQLVSLKFLTEVLSSKIELRDWSVSRNVPEKKVRNRINNNTIIRWNFNDHPVQSPQPCFFQQLQPFFSRTSFNCTFTCSQFVIEWFGPWDFWITHCFASWNNFYF